MPEPPVDGDSSSVRAYRSGETVVVPEVEALNNDAEYGDLRSVTCAPMGEHGIVFMGQASRDGFDPFDLRLVEVLSTYAAVVLDRLTRAQELLAAEEKAEQVNEMKSAFPANMSHEIRTPLTSVIGFAEAIREEVGTGDTTVPQFADLIEQGGHRLLETLGAVSSLSKLEAEEVGVLFEQQAVDQMEGTIEVDTEQGMGTRFVVRLSRLGPQDVGT